MSETEPPSHLPELSTLIENILCAYENFITQPSEKTLHILDNKFQNYNQYYSDNECLQLDHACLLWEVNKEIKLNINSKNVVEKVRFFLLINF